MKNLIKALVILSPILISSCSSNLDNIQKESKTVKELYKYNSTDVSKSTNKYIALGENAGFVRTSQNELENRFPLLPNPALNMFIYPHLNNNSYPVPGYSTTFKMYKVDHYALPNEVY